MKDKIQFYYSDRDIPLVYYGEPPMTPTITVENYCKWYNLYIIDTQGVVTTLPYNEFVKYGKSNEIAVGDHVFNPDVVLRLEDKYNVDSQSLEMIIGRWELEFKGSYER